MYNLDLTIEPVQNTRFLKLYHNLVKQLLKQTYFTETELFCILMIYHKFVILNGPKAKEMTKMQFYHFYENVFEIHDRSIIERIAVLIGRDSQHHISSTGWVKLFAVIMSDSLEDKMQFVFSVYDLHETNFLNLEVVTRFVEKFFEGEDEDEVMEHTTDMVDLLFTKFDVDRDNLISYEEYAAVVRKTPMLLEFLGPCLPSYNALTVTAYCTDVATKMTHLKSCLNLAT